MNVARFERHFSDPSVLSSTNISSVATTEHRLMIIMMKGSGRYLASRRNMETSQLEYCKTGPTAPHRIDS